MKRRYKFILIGLQAFLVSACGSSDTEEIHNLVQFIELDDEVTYVNNSQDYDTTALFLTSSINGATVYVQSDLSKLMIDGSNNILYISEGVSVEDCEVSGNDNTA